ncbi:LytR/AlgR family response regulator transcription factor [Bacteroidota bacterium]
MAEIIKAIIVDDEENSISTLNMLLENYCPQVEIIGKAMTHREAVSTIDELKPDLVFLDISMPDGDGFEVLESVTYRSFEVIFITAYNQYALRAFEFSAIDYLLKPVDYKKLKAAVERFSKINTNELFDSRVGVLKENLQSQSHRIILSSMEGFDIYEISDIVRCEANGSYTNFYFNNKQKLITSKTLNNFEKLLSDLSFSRIHSKHLVNLKYIKKYVSGRGGYVVLEDGSKVDVSERKKRDFIRQMKMTSRST